MININELTHKNKTAESIWAHFGPYYAMFPLSFAFNIVRKYSKEGDIILDPFAGRSLIGKVSESKSILLAGYLVRRSYIQQEKIMLLCGWMRFIANEITIRGKQRICQSFIIFAFVTKCSNSCYQQGRISTGEIIRQMPL